MEPVPSDVIVWCLATGSLGLLIHAHDFALVCASAKLRPRGVVDWAVATLGFFWTFAKWNLGGVLLWAIWSEQALYWYAIGGGAGSMLVWGVLELRLDLTMTSEASEDRAFVWVYSVRKLISYLWWGLCLGTAFWLFLLAFSLTKA